MSVTQVEKGRQDPSRQFVERLDVALVASGQLLAIHKRLVEERARDMNRRQVLCRVATLAAAAVPPIRQALLWRANALCDGVEKPLPLTALQCELTLACRLRQASKYTAVGHMLPRLLAQAQRSTITYAADQRLSAYALLAEVNFLAASFLKKTDEPELAWVAIDRGCAAAEAAEVPLLKATSSYRLANLLLSAGHLTEALDIARREIDRLEPGLGAASPEYLSLYGALCLKSAVIAAREHERVTARQFLIEAKGAADRLGEDRNHLWTAFGPTNVAIHDVSIAVELEDAGEAVERASHVDLSRLPPALLERRSHFFVDVARGNVQRGRDSVAVRALLQAEQIAPEEGVTISWHVPFV